MVRLGGYIFWFLKGKKNSLTEEIGNLNHLNENINAKRNHIIAIVFCFISSPLILVIIYLSISLFNNSEKNCLIYEPLNGGNNWVYNYLDTLNLYSTLSEKRIKIDKKLYYRKTDKYYNSAPIIYFVREENKTIYHYDSITKLESVAIPYPIQNGYIWYHADSSWQYEIISQKVSIKTLNGNFDKLLKIKATQFAKRDNNKFIEYELFYKCGIGLVATKSSGKLLTYLKNYQIN